MSVDKKIVEIFSKQYDGESICDIGRDIFECFDEEYNEAVKDIPADENFISKGTFLVTVVWCADE